jgi:hypothetical protein
MLRLLVLALLLANGGFYAWSQGWLRGYGLGPAAQQESFRLEQQVRPEAVEILSGPEAQQLQARGTQQGECLQAGVFTDLQAAALRQAALAALPEGSWEMQGTTEPARWIVYMGKYPDAQTLARKRTELAALQLRFEPLASPELEYGLSLGGFDTQAQAEAHLAALTRRGVRTASVVQERAEMRGFRLRLPAADAALKEKAEGLRGMLAGKSLRSC